MARRVSINIDLDLARGSKEAHAVTIKRLADAIGAHALEVIEANGYRVRQAQVTTVLHYVRHTLPTTIRKARNLKVVKGA